MSISYLSDNTRKTRRSLLAASLIAYAISKLGLTLTEVQVFGSKFEFQNYSAIPFVLIMVVVYFLVTFIVYAGSEYSHGHRNAVHDYRERIIRGKSNSEFDINESITCLQDEISELSEARVTTSGYQVTFSELPSEVVKSIADKTAEIKRLKRVLSIVTDQQFRVPFYRLFRWAGMRTFCEIALPFIISLYAIAHLAFFTEITNPALNGNVETANTVQPDSNAVVIETPVMPDSLDSISGN